MYLTANIRSKKFKQNICYKDIKDYLGKKFIIYIFIVTRYYELYNKRILNKENFKQ